MSKIIVRLKQTKLKKSSLSNLLGNPVINPEDLRKRAPRAKRNFEFVEKIISFQASTDFESILT